MTQTRDSHGRFKADHHRRNRAIGAVTAVATVASAIGAALHFGLLDRFFPVRDGRDEAVAKGAGAEHRAPDLAQGHPHPGPRDRAPDAFRPDPTGAVPASEREGLRPATGSAPSLVEDRGAMRSETAGNG